MATLKLRKKQLPEDFKSAAGKWYASTVQYPTVDTEMLSEQVSLNTGFARGMVSTVLGNLLTSMEHFLSIGHPVKLGDIGIIRVNASSKAVDSPDDVEVTLIPGFRTTSAIRQMVKNLNYEFISTGGVSDDIGDDQVDTGDNADANENTSGDANGNENAGGGDGGTTNPPAGGGGQSVD